MTRLAILADIHGNLPALEAVLADLVQFNVDQVIVAGDVINWPFMNWHDACRPEAPFTPELLDEFARVDPWQYTPAPYHVNRGTAQRIDASADAV